MWLADTSVKRPVFATMVIMAPVVLGVVSYPEIGVDLFPKVDSPIVTISTHLKGGEPRGHRCRHHGQDRRGGQYDQRRKESITEQHRKGTPG